MSEVNCVTSFLTNLGGQNIASEKIYILLFIEVFVLDIKLYTVYIYIRSIDEQFTLVHAYSNLG